MDNSKATILIVDDEPINLDIICAHLENNNYDLVTASNGQQAWALLESNPTGYDVIILDRMMPILDGMQVLTNIKENEMMEQIPVVMQTAKAENEDVVEGLRAGAYYYLTKPYDGDVLKTIVRSAVNDRFHEKSLHESLREGRQVFDLMTFGRFRIHNLQQCNLVASQVARLCPEPHRVVTGISELLINALEHGNLKIGYEEKSKLMRRGMWQIEVEKRLNASENIGGYIELEFNLHADTVQIRIRDQGEGFDWTPYMDFDPNRAFDPHGRGIAAARLSSFDEVEYIGQGNEVVATIKKVLDG
ncbi:MAG: response regulator [Gammaproteobacteria bacterium]|nr:MAG: response regulator [Gammaproteobacteria bacterium]UCH38819.1 MAG: response regulator [Gammaproteobacteria bacterium]